MRRFAFVVFVAACSLLLVQTPASARCVVLPFDTAVRQAQVVWWGTVTGTQYEPPNWAGSPSGWTLRLRLQDVLKGPGSAGETRLAVPVFCSIGALSQHDAQQYVGQTQLFMGRLQGAVLVPFVQVLQPQDLSPAEQYQRAREVLGLLHAPGVHPTESVTWLLWVFVPAVVVVLVAVGSFIIVRRRRSRGR